MTLHAIRLEVTQRAPFLVAAEDSASFGIDSFLPRDSSGQPIIPGTLMRGVVRDALESICKRCGGKLPGVADDGATFLATLFGAASGGAGDDHGQGGRAPQRGLVTFLDLTADKPKEGTRTLTRIAIDPALGSAGEGQLQVLEQPYAIGEEVVFSGEVRVRGGATAAKVVAALELAARAVTAIGAHKSAGFGRLVRFTSSLVMQDGTPRDPVPKSKTRRWVATLDIKDPFLVSAERVAPNVFESAIIISGAVIKGAIADALAPLSQDMGDFLAAAVFREARPELNLPGRPPAVVPRIVPLSIGVWDDGQGENEKQVGCALRDQEPRVGAAGDALHPPRFSIDWKPEDRAAVANHFNLLGPSFMTMDMARDQLHFTTHTRTAIDYRKGTAAYDEVAEAGQLFVYEMVSPRESHSTRWRFEIVSDRPDAAEHLSEIDGLEVLIGKMPTPATIKDIAPSKRPPDEGWVLDLDDGRKAAAILIETPALLSPIDKLHAANGDIRPVYAETFKSIFDGLDVQLGPFFARQSLIGGWQAMRYRGGPGRPYTPWLATERGSVFLLSVPAKKGMSFKRRLTMLLEQGLPEADAIVGASWEVCPLPRVNGFGQISLHDPRKLARRPVSSERPAR
jgi:hypothetical protein